MFRVNVRTQIVAGSLHYHVRVASFRAGYWCVCGVLQLHEPEWLEFLRVCEAFSVEVTIGETLPIASA
jgi:hypothetical protein